MLRLQLGAGIGTLVALGALALVPPGCSAAGDAKTLTSATSGGGGAGGDSEVASSGSGGSGGGGGAGGAGGAPAPCDPFDGAVLAIDELFVGGRTFAGETKPDAWEGFGFDLDDSNTVASFATHCKPAAGGTTDAFVDGPSGRDNAFGKTVLPLINALVPPLDGQANDAITAGQFTQIFTFEKLGPEGDKEPVLTKLYGASSLGKSPAWDGSDCWPVLHETLADPKDIGSAKTTFATAKLANNIWTSEGTQELVLTLNVLGQSIPIKLYGARLKVTLAPTHEGGALGQLGGYVKTEEFVTTLRGFAGAINASACTLFDTSLSDQLRRASDILDDGTQDPAKTCNAISVGMGFTLRKVGLGTVAPAAPEPTDFCK